MKEKELSKHQVYIYMCVSVLIGIAIHNLLGNMYHSLGVMVFFCVYLCCYIKKIPHIILYIISIALSYSTGILIAESEANQIHHKKAYITEVSENKSFTFEILDIYKVKEHAKQYRVILDATDIYGLITVPYNFDLNRGDVIKSFAGIESIINIGDDFKYAEYMQTKNIFFQSYVASFSHLSPRTPGKILQYIEHIRSTSLSVIHRLYPKEEAIFLGGILIGARESLPKKLQTHFNNSGLTHFIAVSGFNITILIIFLATITKYLPTIVQVCVVCISIVLFTMLVGETAPVIRASIMGGLGYVCLSLGRSSHVVSLIVTTAVIMVVYNPTSINYDVSLHLSFLAVIGIVSLQGWYTKIFSWAPTTLALREALVLTFAALTTTLPIMLVNFGQVSLLAPLANILVTWTIPLAMLGGFISLVFWFIFQPFAWVFGYLTYLLLRWDIAVVHVIGSWEYSVWYYDLGRYKYIFLLLYFWVLCFCVIWFWRRKKENE